MNCLADGPPWDGEICIECLKEYENKRDHSLDGGSRSGLPNFLLSD